MARPKTTKIEGIQAATQGLPSSKEAKVNGFKTDQKQRGRKRGRDEIIDSPVAKKVKRTELFPPKVEDGVILTVGTGDIGQLGLGPNVEEKTRPGVVPDLAQVVAVAAGGLHTICLTKEGKVYSWGCNDEGGLGRLTETEEDNFSSAEVVIPGLVAQISAGDCHSVALTTDGRVFAWGSFRDNSGPLGFIEKGTIQTTPVQFLEGISFTKIASGNNHIVLLSDSGTVYTCGCGESGQLGRIAEYFASRDSRNRKGTETQLNPLPIKVYKSHKAVRFDNVWAGGYATFIRACITGDIYGFGLNNYCQLGDEDTNMKFQPVAIKSYKGKQWKHFSPGQHHSIALDEEGTVYVMGRNEYGRLGLGDGSKDATTPTPLTSLSGKAKHVAAGECVSFVVLENGEAYGFGMGTNNQLSQGNEDDLWVPTLLSGKQLSDRKVISLEAGGQHTVILAVPKS